jgi:hypothetical protein
MQREDSFHSLAKGDFAYRECGVIPGPALADDRAFENLNPLFITFFDNDVDTHRISGAELRQVLLHLQLFNFF